MNQFFVKKEQLSLNPIEFSPEILLLAFIHFPSSPFSPSPPLHKKNSTSKVKQVATKYSQMLVLFLGSAENKLLVQFP